eukprot:1193282-Prorocentrum_minimum.AAC.5
MYRIRPYEGSADPFPRMQEPLLAVLNSWRDTPPGSEAPPIFVQSITVRGVKCKAVDVHGILRAYSIFNDAPGAISIGRLSLANVQAEMCYHDDKLGEPGESEVLYGVDGKEQVDLTDGGAPAVMHLPRTLAPSDMTSRTLGCNLESPFRHEFSSPQVQPACRLRSLITSEPSEAHSPARFRSAIADSHTPRSRIPRTPFPRPVSKSSANDFRRRIERILRW